MGRAARCPRGPAVRSVGFNEAGDAPTGLRAALSCPSGGWFARRANRSRKIS